MKAYRTHQVPAAGVAALLWVAMISVSPVQAVDLPPGGDVALSGLPGGVGPGTVIYDELNEFTITGGGGALLYRGVLQARVVRLTATGRLAFAYLVRDTQPGLNGIVDETSHTDFHFVHTFVEYSTTSIGTVVPRRARRSDDGATVTFDFSAEPIFSGSESKFFEIATNAESFEVSGTTRISLSTGQFVDIVTPRPAREPGCHGIDFEDLPPEGVFPNGTAFLSNNVVLRVRDFFLGPGGCVNPYVLGLASVSTGGDACGSGQELRVNNVNIEFDYGVPLTALVIHYGEYGGNVNLTVNGACANVQNFADLPPFLGGVSVSVSDQGPPGQSCGRIVLNGPIFQAAVGGQELIIDDVECRADPCIDDQEPPIAQIDAPPEFTCVCDPVVVTGTAADANFDHYALEVRRVGDVAWTPIAFGGSQVFGGVLGVWNAAGLPQGYYVIRLTVRDECGLSETDVHVVWLGGVFDNLTVRDPDNGGVYGGNICFDGTVSDNFCFDQYIVEYSPAGANAWMDVAPGMPVYTTPVINDPFATWNTVTAGVPDGAYDVRVMATEDCGGSAQEMRTLVVDNTAPTAVITGPEPCDYVEGIVSITGTANDANLAAWVVQYTGDGTPGWVTIAAGNSPVINGTLATWNTTELKHCAYTLRLIVTDKAVINCNGAIHHQSEYLVSVNIGTCGDFDVDNDGDVDLFDYRSFEEAFTGP